MIQRSSYWTALALAGTLSWPGGVAVADEPLNRTALISACKTEAKRGHLAGFLQERREHAQRMAAICDEWLTVAEEKREDLLERCLAEARRGPSIGHRTRTWYASHVYRLRKICRNLAAT
jgi:hypothetical protein